MAKARDKGIDNGGFADVGVANYTDRDSPFEVLARSIGFQSAEEGFSGILLCEGFMVVGAGVRCRGAGTEGECGVVAAEMEEPGLQNGRENEVDFVEDEDKAFGAAGEGGYLTFCGAGAGAVGVAGIEHVEEDIGGGEDGLEGFGEGAGGGVFRDRNDGY